MASVGQRGSLWCVNRSRLKSVYYQHVGNIPKVIQLFPWIQLLAVNYRTGQSCFEVRTVEEQRNPIQNKKKKPTLLCFPFSWKVSCFFFFFRSLLGSWHPLISSHLCLWHRARRRWLVWHRMPTPAVQLGTLWRTNKKPRKPDPTIFLWIERAVFMRWKVFVCVYLYRDALHICA